MEERIQTVSARYFEQKISSIELVTGAGNGHSYVVGRDFVHEIKLSYAQNGQYEYSYFYAITGKDGVLIATIKENCPIVITYK